MKRLTFLSENKMKKRVREKHPARDPDMKKLFKPFRKEMIVKTVTVYKGGRRFFFTKKAAARNEVREMLRTQCDCYDSPNGGYYDPEPRHYSCRYHAMQMDDWKKLRDRMAKILLKEWSKK